MDVRIRRFEEADIPFGMRLKGIAGWNQSPEDWRRFAALCPQGCFVAEVDGQPAGTATTTPYGDRFGWVGMVLVLPEFRRRGLGTRLLAHAIGSLESSGVRCVRLDATPLGKKLYDTLGFEDEYGLRRVEGTARATNGRAAPLRDADMAAVAAYDADRFGADRRAMLAMLMRQEPELSFLARRRDGEIAGYLMARPGEHAHQIGPWIAEDPSAAEELFAAALDALAGRRVFLDIPLVGPEPSAICERYGFTIQRPFIRMYRGALAHPGRPSAAYAICGVETG